MPEATEHPAAAPDAPAHDAPDGGTGERLRRLEQTLAALQDTTATEQRVAARVVARITEQMAAAGPPNGTPPAGLTAGDATGVGGLVGAALGSNAFHALATQAVGHAARGFWDRLGLVREIRLMVRMYLDPRYRLSRPAQFGVPLVLALMVLNFFLAYSLPIVGSYVGPVIERLVLVILSVALYKLLSREANRYADVLDYLARYGS